MIDGLHRNVSLLAVVFLVLHVITSVLDSFAPISLTAAVIPFISSYRPFWLGLGALAFDLLLALTITSLLRARIGHRVWRRVHWLAYACWPIALIHTLRHRQRRQQRLAAAAERRLRAGRRRSRVFSRALPDCRRTRACAAPRSAAPPPSRCSS